MKRKAVSKFAVESFGISNAVESGISFLMELKSIPSELLEKNNSTNSSDKNIEKSEIEYEDFKKMVGNDVMLLLAKYQADLINKINPINEDNFQEIKNGVINLLKKADPEFSNFFKVNLEKYTNPTEFFSMMKSRFLNALQSFFEHKIRILCHEVNLEKLSKDEFDEILIDMNFHCIKCVQDLIGLFTPKTTNPKVLKIEQEIRKMGVKNVNFANDLGQANLIKDAVIDLVKTGIPLPESITVSTIIPFGTRGYNIAVLSKSKHDAHLLFMTSEEKKFNTMMKNGMCELAPQTKTFKNASPEMQTNYLEQMGCVIQTMQSTNNPKHHVFHEIAHSFSSMSLDVLLRKLSPQELEVAKSVSHYAASNPNGREVVPEIFAKIMDKQELTPAQIKLYKKLGGIFPQY